ncbi:MAG: hypothetical protein MI757_10410, partial [Pirellulales bacterium]|nr:hypothetical protein [Pirellulales bacterium]
RCSNRDRDCLLLLRNKGTFRENPSQEQRVLAESVRATRVGHSLLVQSPRSSHLHQIVDSSPRGMK